MRKMTYHVQVFPKKENDKRQFWFQFGKMTIHPDHSRNFSNTKDFSTKKKVESFLAWLDKNYPDTIVQILETRSYSRCAYEIEMGE